MIICIIKSDTTSSENDPFMINSFLLGINSEGNVNNDGDGTGRGGGGGGGEINVDIDSKIVDSFEYMIKSDNDIEYNTIHKAKYNIQQKRKEFLHYLSNSSNNFTSIQCYNYKDFYYLLYKICSKSVLCSERYNLDNINSIVSNNDNDDGSKTLANNILKHSFKKFVYQLSLSQLFIVHDHNEEGINNTITTEEDNQEHQKQNNLFLLEDNWPIEWIPRYIVELDNGSRNGDIGRINKKDINSRCSETFNMYSTENIGFIHSTLHLLHLYKTYVVNEFQCNDANERLVLDQFNRPQCVCVNGKSCNNDNNATVLIIIIAVIFLALLVVNIFVVFFRTPSLIRKLDQINRQNQQQQQPLLNNKQR